MLDYPLSGDFDEEEDFYNFCKQCRPSYPPVPAPASAVRLCRSLRKAGFCRRNCPGLFEGIFAVAEDYVPHRYGDVEDYWEDAYENRRLFYGK